MSNGSSAFHRSEHDRPWGRAARQGWRMRNLEEVLSIYNDDPLPDGDVLLLTDLSVVQEVEGLADHWDAVLRRNIADVLREVGATELVVAIARRDQQLKPADHAIWADLREELLDSEVTVRPLVALNAA